MSEFSEWLLAELDRRGWSKNELSRRADLSKGAISGVLSKDGNPGIKFCLGVARAFGIAPDEVLHKAGLPSLAWSASPSKEELVISLSYLSEEDRLTLLKIARLMLKAQGIEVLPSQEEPEE